MTIKAKCGDFTSLTLREGHILRVLRRIFRLRREEVEGGWRRLHNEELHNSYVSSNVIRRMRWDM
jgi:hypothetical protein